MKPEDKVRAGFDAWADEYGLRSEPNYSVLTGADCLAAYRAAYAQARRDLASGIEESIANMDNADVSGSRKQIEYFKAGARRVIEAVNLALIKD